MSVIIKLEVGFDDVVVTFVEAGATDEVKEAEAEDGASGDDGELLEAEDDIVVEAAKAKSLFFNGMRLEGTIGVEGSSTVMSIGSDT